jgi:hypothetical protein
MSLARYADWKCTRISIVGNLERRDLLGGLDVDTLMLLRFAALWSNAPCSRVGTPDVASPIPNLGSGWRGIVSFNARLYYFPTK